ncbi:MAG: putative baseplate assembly protein [Cyanobacteria bacterium P01_G01_bin.67]
MNNDCGCCEGLDVITPEPIFNRPGLDALSYRVGNHASFLESMQARLSSPIEPSTDKERQEKLKKLQEQLKNLKTRDSSDWSIALLDAWATVADVLSFYQERIANEGFLNTAIERRSILELTNLVGYRLKPGVAASVYLAFTLEKDYNNVEIPEGTRSQSIPQPGETAQTFETVEKIQASADWNKLQPQQTEDLKIPTKEGKFTFYIKGAATNLKPNSPLLLVVKSNDSEVLKTNDKEAAFFYKLQAIEFQAKDSRTKVQITVEENSEISKIGMLFFDSELINNDLKKITTAIDLEKAKGEIEKLKENYNDKYFGVEEFLTELSELNNIEEIREKIEGNKENKVEGFSDKIKKLKLSVYSFQVVASLYGHNSPGYIYGPNGDTSPKPEFKPIEIQENDRILNLDSVYEGILSESYIAISETNENTIRKIVAVDRISRVDYGISAKTTRLTGNKTLWSPTFEKIRGITVYAQPEPLELAKSPINKPVKENEIVLDGIYENLEIGRKFLISGQKVKELENGKYQKTNELVSELIIFGNVIKNENSSVLLLVNSLKNAYARETVVIYGNIAKATHGETRTEVLGSGDARKSLQQFTLGQSPLTYLSTPTPAGIDSSLQIRVNDVLWHEVESLEELDEGDRNYIARTDNEQKTTITFGNGRNGALLPTGVGNIMAKYRTSIGKSGNVKAEQISQLISRPLGLKEVINPIAATGGADPEELEDARRNALLPLFAMDRLVSVQDYEDFARAFAGIGKASARYLSDGSRELVYLTIAGADNIPITSESELYTNLISVLRQFGTLPQALEVDIYKPINLKILANVQILPDYLWGSVQPVIRTALLDKFSFRNRELGQDVTLAEVISTIQQVLGVSYVDVDFLGVEEETPQPLTRPKSRVIANLARVDPDSTSRPLPLNPAELIFLSPDKPDNLILREVNNE